ncbi:MAG: Maf family protein [bacterium]
MAAMNKLLLASSSPRRRELLESAGFECVIRPPEVDESRRPDEGPREYAQRMAVAKARAVAGAVDPARDGADVIVAADTIVVQDDAIFGKPADEAEARQVLARLSGGWHQVLTGYAVVRVGSGAEEAPRAGLAETDVRFKELTEHELDWYVSSGDWRGKAGGYAIQLRAGFMVTDLVGSYSNVVGLPLSQVVDELAALGVVPGGGS